MGQHSREYKERRNVLYRRLQSSKGMIKEYERLIAEGEAKVKDLVEVKLPEWRRKLAESKQSYEYSSRQWAAQYEDTEQDSKKEKIARFKDALEKLEAQLSIEQRDEKERQHAKKKRH